MNLFSIVIALCLLFAVILVVIRLAKNRRRGGCGSCCGDCNSACPYREGKNAEEKNAARR